MCIRDRFLMEGFTPSLYESLGIYIPLIVVNCIILGRAESYASKNPVLPSIFDGLGMGLGFTVGLVAIGLVREDVYKRQPLYRLSGYRTHLRFAAPTFSFFHGSVQALPA